MQLVSKLLCPVILKMGADDSELRTAVLKLVSLLNTRIKASPALKLPAEELIKVFRDNCGSPLIANVALMELVMALERCTAADLRSLVRIGLPSLLTLSNDHSFISFSRCLRESGPRSGASENVPDLNCGMNAAALFHTSCTQKTVPEAQ